MTSDETLAGYGVKGFSVVDKMDRLRYVGRDINFEDNDAMGFLIHRLIEE
jgi:hypothetical protein